MLAQEFLRNGDTSGSAALAGMILSNKLWVANAGDCRAVLVTGSSVYQLTRDHCPSDPSERARIEKAGGAILNVNERKLLLCGLVVTKRHIMSRILPSGLSVARSIGDSRVKQALPEAVVSSPDVCCCPLSSTDEFAIIATDGVFGPGGGGLSNKDASDIVRSALAEGKEMNMDRTSSLASFAAKRLAEASVERARYLRRDADNCGVIVLLFSPSFQVSESDH